MDTLKAKAIKLGATDFGTSTVQSKRFYVVYDKKKINFGLKGGSTFIDHRNNIKKAAWIARHSKIKLSDGSLAYKNKHQPSYWAYHLLW